MITEQDRAFIVWRDNHDPRKYPAERDAFKAGWSAAVEADRQDRTAKPLPELIVTKGGIPFEDQNEAIRQFKEACMAAADAKADRQDHFRGVTKMMDQSGGVSEMVPSDEAIQVLAKQYDCHCAPGFMGFARALLSRYSSGQPKPSNSGELERPAASAEPCKTCGGSGWIGGPTYYQPDEGGEPCPDCAAPVAQEPVGTVRWRGSPYPSALVDWCGRPPEDGTPIFAAPVAAQAQQQIHPAIREGVEAAFEQRPGWLEKIGAAVRYLPDVAAQAQPTMPPLTHAMRAVLRNEHCVYDSEDTLYAALGAAAQDREDAQ
ncbi:hypothetical protein ACMHYJ_14395 [Castellaniella hirudinis]|uniref:hypothetical protein n=1 Tax=Castellaniella hirudinis TaxID=1144617 RepID=UPI0039C3CEE4